MSFEQQVGNALDAIKNPNDAADLVTWNEVRNLMLMFAQRADRTDFTGTVKMFAGSTAPSNWKMCDGSLLNIADYPQLYALINTQFGGDGTTTFALPDLRGRVPVGAGTGMGLTNRNLAQMGGVEKVSLSAAEMPTHTHELQGEVKINVADQYGNIGSAIGNFLGRKAMEVTQEIGIEVYVDKTMATFTQNYLLGGVTHELTAAQTGGSQAHENMQPYLGLNFIICTNGL